MSRKEKTEIRVFLPDWLLEEVDEDKRGDSPSETIRIILTNHYTGKIDREVLDKILRILDSEDVFPNPEEVDYT